MEGQSVWDAPRFITVALQLVFLLSTFPDASSQTTSNLNQPALPPGVGIRIEAQPDTGTIGDRIQIDLHVTMPSDWRMEIPKLGSRAGDFFILDFYPGFAAAETSKLQKQSETSPIPDDGLRRHRARIIVAVYKTGTFEFPSIPIILKTSEGREIALSSPPVTIDIQSVLAEDDQNLLDLKKQVEIPGTTGWALWLALALAACILGLVGRHLWRKRRISGLALASIPIRDPLDVAEEDLQALLARGHPDRIHAKQFYVLLSEIVKRILESGYGIQTEEKTTLEIMEGLRNNPLLESATLARIESFFVQCDMVKFAKYIPSDTEHQNAANDAMQILTKAKQSRQSPVVSAPEAFANS